MPLKILLVFALLLCQSLGFAQNGKIVAKRVVDLSQTPVWKKLTVQDTLKPEYKYLNELNFYFIKYQSDSLIVRGMVIEPKREGNFPVVIFNRGGNRNFAPLTVGTLINYTSKLANEGYIIIGSNYREQDEFGGRDINDVLYLTETVKEIEKANAKRIGMFGWSRGGIMTYLTLKQSNKIKTAIVGNGPTDLFNTIEERPIIETKVLSECVPNYHQNKELELKKRSAIYWADDLNKESSLLILCGTKDKRVNYLQAEQMAKKLTALKYQVELKKFETDHFFTDKKDELNQEIIRWFSEHL